MRSPENKPKHRDNILFRVNQGTLKNPRLDSEIAVDRRSSIESVYSYSPALAR